MTVTVMSHMDIRRGTAVILCLMSADNPALQHNSEQGSAWRVHSLQLRVTTHTFFADVMDQLQLTVASTAVRLPPYYGGFRDYS